MLKVQVGNIFESDAQTIVNTVNCVGVMGKGIALEFKKRFPSMYKDYVSRCQEREVKLGEPYIFKRTVPPWIINFPTKDHWRSLAKVENIIRGLDYLVSKYQEWGVQSLAVPPLGSGLGQLEWMIIGPILYKYLDRMEIPVTLYAPFGTPADELEFSFLSSPNTQLTLKAPSPEWVKPAWVALAQIVHRLESQPYHWPIGRTIFQKMAYIAQYEGLPLELEYKKGSYGPYTPMLKKVVSSLINNGILKEERSGNLFEVKTGPQFDNAAITYANEIRNWESIVNRVSNLFIRTDTRQSEILSTVLYATEELRLQSSDKPSELEVINAVKEWKIRRKPPLDEKLIASTVRNLAALDWLDVKASKELPITDEEMLDI